MATTGIRRCGKITFRKVKEIEIIVVALGSDKVSSEFRAPNSVGMRFFALSLIKTMVWLEVTLGGLDWGVPSCDLRLRSVSGFKKRNLSLFSVEEVVKSSPIQWKSNPNRPINWRGRCNGIVMVGEIWAFARTTSMLCGLSYKKIGCSVGLSKAYRMLSCSSRSN